MKIKSDKKIVLATRNNDKVKEIKQALQGLELNILSLKNVSFVPEVIEDGQTLEENAKKKALHVYNATGKLSLADDSGLEVDFLQGAPGVYSSRFAGTPPSYEANNRKLLHLLKDVPWEKRTARFRCVMVLACEREVKIVESICEGFITTEPRGENGFGYDPLFYLPEYGKTFAEMPLNFKNKISHRGRALKKIRRILEAYNLGSE